MNDQNPFGLSEDELKFVNQNYVKWGIRLFVIALITAAVVWGGINIAPLIALALANWLWMLVYAAGAWLAWKIISNKMLIRAISKLIDNLGYRAYMAVIQQDPIASAEGSLSEMETAESELGDLIGELEGNKSMQEEELAGIRKAHETANNMAVQAGKEGDSTMSQVYQEEALSYKNAYEEAQPYYKLVSDLTEYYVKAQKWVNVTIRRHRNTLDSKKRLYRIADLGQQSVDKIKKVMGGKQFKEFSIAIDALTANIHSDVGKVKNFMRATKPILDKQDFESRAFSRQAAAEFQKFVQDAPFLDESDKQKLLGVASVENAIPAQLEVATTDREAVVVPAVPASKDKFNRF